MHRMEWSWDAHPLHRLHSCVPMYVVVANSDATFARRESFGHCRNNCAAVEGEKGHEIE